MNIRPFAAWRPAPGMAADVACPPYDVVDTGEARRIAGDNPRCFLRVSRAELELPPGSDPHAPEVYARAAETYRRFKAQGWLRQDARPGLYLYRQVRGDHAQAGFVVVYHADDYASGRIRRHENTRPVPENDRTRHLEATGAQAGPVFLAYRDRPELDALAAEAQAGAPLDDFTAPDGVRHTVWSVLRPDAVSAAFARVECAYIADGHHRAAAGARVALRRRAARPGRGPDAESDWILGVLFPASQLRILPYNRCVRDLAGRAPEAFLDALRAAGFAVAPAAEAAPPCAGEARMFLGDRWWRLAWTSPDPAADPVAALDVSVLQDRAFQPLLGIDDPRSNDRIEFVGGIRGAGELERRVREGRAAAAFSLYPTSMEQLLAVSDAGRLMPPKSTWFEPKLRSGLVIHDIGEKTTP